MVVPKSPLKLNIFETLRLGGSGLDFGGPGPRFWRVWGSFSKVLAVINGAKNAKKRQKPAKQKLNHKSPGAPMPSYGWAEIFRGGVGWR